MRVGAFLQQHEIQRLPLLSELIRLLVQVALVFDTLGLLQTDLVPTLAKSCVDFLGGGAGCALLRFYDMALRD